MTPERQERLLSVLNKRQNNITVVLENVFDPHNISAVMRTCDAVGIQDIYVLNTKIARHKKWGQKSSSSAAKWLSIHQFTDANECFADLRRHYSRILTTHLSSNAVSLHEIDFTIHTSFGVLLKSFIIIIICRHFWILLYNFSQLFTFIST